MKAIWNGEVIAESDDTVVVENNHYFPTDSLKKEFFTDSDLTSVCHWKGTAKYYNVTVNGKANDNAAWYYQDPSELAKPIKNKVAFWKGVQITK
jgi:uncharacterized protein (DUF427 family)